MGDLKGIPTVSLVHRFIKSNRKVSLDLGISNWDWIWKCDSIPLIKYFIWPYNHDRISSENLIHKKGMHTNLLCKLCGNYEEKRTPFISFVIVELPRKFGLICRIVKTSIWLTSMIGWNQIAGLLFYKRKESSGVLYLPQLFGCYGRVKTHVFSIIP